MGHTAITCYYWFDNAYQTQPSPHSAYTAAIIHSPHLDAWYPDSGGTNHITSDLGNFSVRSEYHGNDQVQVPSATLSPGTVPSIVSSFIPRVGHPPHCVTARPLRAPRSTTPLPTHVVSPSDTSPQPDVYTDSHLQPPSPTTLDTMAAHRDHHQEPVGINTSSMHADPPSDNAIVSSSLPVSTRRSLRMWNPTQYTDYMTYSVTRHPLPGSPTSKLESSCFTEANKFVV
ncbi:hypothetical protein NE237_007752 [Protea cynaroides]|uniref:Uncharacterized protein n=1 Tax=Protea cynaroides TaxID=273540 RepID=A0A9Q0QWH6_9MAGN|nr:hypothetical protein NE237_007752 [Protea cynaroides]